MSRTEDLRTLGFVNEPTEHELKKRFHCQCLLHHPDRGGSAEKFDNLNAAYRRLKAQPPKCKACKGVGRIGQGTGFFSITKPCTSCGGRGK